VGCDVEWPRAEKGDISFFSAVHQLLLTARARAENFILNVKHEHPGWGARKIRKRLIRRFSAIPIPAKSTIHVVLDRPRPDRRNLKRCVQQLPAGYRTVFALHYEHNEIAAILGRTAGDSKSQLHFTSPSATSLALSAKLPSQSSEASLAPNDFEGR